MQSFRSRFSEMSLTPCLSFYIPRHLMFLRVVWKTAYNTRYTNTYLLTLLL
jgi:hypothetical protein